jgi:hypothetical protein
LWVLPQLLCEVPVPLTRRELLRVGAFAPLGFVAGRAATVLGQVITRSAPGLRPGAAGTSATRCAACGANDHTMLDPRCPAAKRVI